MFFTTTNLNKAAGPEPCSPALSCRINPWPAAQLRGVANPPEVRVQAAASSHERKALAAVQHRAVRQAACRQGTWAACTELRAGHPPHRFPTCCSTPEHALRAGCGTGTCQLSPSDLWHIWGGWLEHCLQPQVTFGHVCSSCWEHFPYRFRSKAAPTQTWVSQVSQLHAVLKACPRCSSTLLLPCLKLPSSLQKD